MKTPWLIAVRPTPAVLERHNKPASTMELYEATNWHTWQADPEGAKYLVLDIDYGPSVRWSFDLIDQVTITRRTEGDK